ncbi:hypothetical protein RND81_05G257000 [Saponaria officinalis]|uniref:Outer envelope protein 61 n=1 Tax=Saponaria officinalis TaxID=3572 RepID=A0AAW1L1Z9_SAPOF
MSRMSPVELAKIQQQMMSNPDLLNMATESMKNMRPEGLKYAADQMKNVRLEDMANIGEKMANASPEEIAAIRARADARMTYELNAAELLKKQGNQLHRQGKYREAAQKYSLAKKNLKGVPVAKGRTLQLACSLNLMSCYLKTKEFHECIAEGSEVLAYDEMNVKALYRRGQAYKELGRLEMSRMSPAELAKIQQQMMSNLELLNMATESMKNMRPEDLKYAADQMKNVWLEDMADIGEKMANASPEEIAATRSRADAQITYELNAAELLKKQGNQLHSQGKYQEAAQKYSLAKKNLKGVPVAKGRTLQLACSLNLMSCYLKTKEFHECIAEGSEVLAYDEKNVKALYRRGQAYKELGRLEEQMSRMSPAELAKIQQQMMSNPDLLNMATESMKNMRPEDLKYAADQMKNVRLEDMADIGEKMANASPEEIAAIRARADAQMTYELNAAELLKKQGNQLHSQGKYQEAAQKYSLAKKNLKGVPVAKGRTLQLACSLNLMSCYLKTKEFHECIAEGSEVLAYDEKNVKALYRRGQAYKELGRLEDALSNLTKAHENSPDDNIITEVLSAVTERLGKDGITRTSTGLIIEEITKEIETAKAKKKTSRESLVTPPEESRTRSDDRSETITKRSTTDSDSLQALKDDPDTIRSFQNFMSNADPEIFAKMSGGRTGEVPVDMLKTTTNMIGRMSPDELQNMIKMASSFQGDSSPFGGSPFDPNFGSTSAPPNLSPEMLKTAGDMMSKMQPEELQRMFEMSLKQGDSAPSSSSVRLNTGSASNFSESLDSPVDWNDTLSDSSSTSSSFPNVGSTSQSNFPTSMNDMQEQMRNQMKDPAMRQMFSSMMKNMSPDMMANMSEQFGLKLSKEDAAKAQEAMASLSPEALDNMMRWADRIQRGVEGAKKTKNWLLGRRGMILAICMLILAVILHRFGFIGS